MKKYYLLCTTAILCCYLGVYRGYLALWRQSGLQPDRIYPYRTGLFPVKDQSDLERGIPFSSAAELNRLLEDYLS